MTPDGGVLEVGQEDYSKVISGSDIPILIDFSASWCAPCRAMQPILAEIAAEHAGTIAIGRVDIDRNPGIAMEFDVMSLPTLIVFSGGQVAKKLVGHMSKSRLLTELAPWLE